MTTMQLQWNSLVWHRGHKVEVAAESTEGRTNVDDLPSCISVTCVDCDVVLGMVVESSQRVRQQELREMQQLEDDRARMMSMPEED